MRVVRSAPVVTSRFPPWLNAAESTGAPVPEDVAAAFPVEASQSRAAPSRPSVTTRRPDGSKTAPASGDPASSVLSRPMRRRVVDPRLPVGARGQDQSSVPAVERRRHRPARRKHRPETRGEQRRAEHVLGLDARATAAPRSTRPSGPAADPSRGSRARSRRARARGPACACGRAWLRCVSAKTATAAVSASAISDAVGDRRAGAGACARPPGARARAAARPSRPAPRRRARRGRSRSAARRRSRRPPRGRIRSCPSVSSTAPSSVSSTDAYSARSAARCAIFVPDGVTRRSKMLAATSFCADPSPASARSRCSRTIASAPPSADQCLQPRTCRSPPRAPRPTGARARAGGTAPRCARPALRRPPGRARRRPARAARSRPGPAPPRRARARPPRARR